MYRIILWGLGIDYNSHLNMIKYMEEKGTLKVMAITATEVPKLKYIDGYNVIEKTSVVRVEYDYILIMNNKYFMDICRELIDLGIKKEKIISGRVLDIPNLDFSRYIELKTSKISIISNNCWGGMASNTLGLEHLSPFKNLFLEDVDYIKLLNNLEHYLACKPVYNRMSEDIHSGETYPVLLLDDIEIHCNHDKDSISAISNWNRRCKKVNFNNLFVEMYTLDRNVAEKFCQVKGYQKKICFVPFKTDRKELMYLPMMPEQKEFYETVNSSAGNGKNGYMYDLSILLLEGTIVSRVKL